MRKQFKKAISILLAVLMLATLATVAIAEDDRSENEDERYEDGERYEDEDRGDDEDYEDENDAKSGSASGESENTEDTRIYLADYYAGTKLDLEQYLGKVVIINYFTEWCPYCMDEMPDFQKILEAYNPESLVVLLVHPWDGEDASNSANVVGRFGLQAATVVEDEDFAITAAIGVPGYPTTIIADAFGYLSYAEASRISFETLAEVLDTLGVAKAGEAPSVFTQPQPSSSQSAPATDTNSGATPTP